MFDAARAALGWSGSATNPAVVKTHRGMIAAFGTHVIKPGVMPVEFGKSLNQVERLRLLADYTGEAIDAKRVARALEQAEAFVQAVARRFAAEQHT